MASSSADPPGVQLERLDLVAVQQRQGSTPPASRSPGTPRPFLSPWGRPSGLPWRARQPSRARTGTLAGAREPHAYRASAISWTLPRIGTIITLTLILRLSADRQSRNDMA